jgi:hypothetical protein
MLRRGEHLCRFSCCVTNNQGLAWLSLSLRERAEEARCSAGAQWSNKKEGNSGLVELIWQTLGFVIVIAGKASFLSFWL